MGRLEEIEKIRGDDLRTLKENPYLRDKEEWETTVFIADLVSEVHRLMGAIEKHRDTPITYYRDCVATLQGDYFSRDEELYKALEDNHDPDRPKLNEIHS